jgi:thiol-disulfide isomerase/thioredoxin
MLVIVFKSTCPACERTAPLWKELAAGDTSVDVIAINNEGTGTAREWLARHEITPTDLVIPAAPEDMIAKWGIPGVPVTLVVGNDGSVKAAHLGTIDRTLREEIRRALRGA